ncbi:ER-derived vesicles protein erv46 [Spiromyces aspiralis]|uniref:ER-derived vesicles protein erv46 n=1 Tax=Spiromyces aspiralis TaxID=68401 RepID=A0ACC1HTN6_9FUNG|nr:ER-derived vesicles protein erv46 [Spiromyces aspiralis]
MAKRGSLASRFKTFDAYAKATDDVSIRTVSGALITLISGFIIVLLVFNEYTEYRKVESKAELVVDKTLDEKMPINLDITFHNAPCVLLGLDMVNSLGEHEVNAFHHITKTRLGKDVPANYCGDCYGGIPPKSGCCNTCEDVHQAYLRKGWAFTDPDDIEQCKREHYIENIQGQAGEGCRLKGMLNVNKVAGNFHIMAGDTVKHANGHLHALYNYMPQNFDLSHTIHRLSFGVEFEGQDNPLDGRSKNATSRGANFQYFVKVVSSEVRYLNGKTLLSNQYSVTELDRDTEEGNVHGHSNMLPTFKVAYDISPMKIIYTEHKRSLGSFLTSTCAIVGGIFTVAGIIDSFVFRTKQAIYKKHQLGKLE